MIRFIFILIPFFLSACTFLPGTQVEVQDNAMLFSGSWFSMQVPALWKVNSGMLLGNPKFWSLELALVSPDVRYGFSNNLIVIKDTLNGIITSAKYAELNAIQTKGNYLEYTKISNDLLIFSDSDESRVIVFEAKYNTDTPKLKFVQTAKVCGTNVYVIHFALALDKSPDAYIALAKTFTCK